MQMLLVTPRRYFFGAISNQISIFVHINLIVIIGISISNSFTTVLRPFITIYSIFGLVRDSLIKFSVIIRYISDNRVACFFFDSGNMGVLDNVCERRDQNEFTGYYLPEKCKFILPHIYSITSFILTQSLGLVNN